MIVSIFCTVLSIVGIYGYFIDNNILLIVGVGSIIIELLYGIFTKKLKTITPFVISIAIGITCCKNIWKGIGIGLCFCHIIMFLPGFILMAIAMIFNKNKNIEK